MRFDFTHSKKRHTEDVPQRWTILWPLPMIITLTKGIPIYRFKLIFENRSSDAPLAPKVIVLSAFLSIIVNSSQPPWPHSQVNYHSFWTSKHILFSSQGRSLKLLVYLPICQSGTLTGCFDSGLQSTFRFPNLSISLDCPCFSHLVANNFHFSMLIPYLFRSFFLFSSSVSRSVI